MSDKLIVSGKGAVLGRIGSYVSKELLKGKSVVLLDCEEIIVSGKKDVFVSKILAKRRMGQGSSLKGPKYIFRADLLVKRILRGMLPWDRAKGKEAHKRLKCHIGNGDLKEDLLKDVKTVEHKKPRNYFTIKEVIRRLK